MEFIVSEELSDVKKIPMVDKKTTTSRFITKSRPTAGCDETVQARKTSNITLLCKRGIDMDETATHDVRRDLFYDE